MKRLAALAGVVAALAAPALASAHPLGNFTVNRFSQIELAGNRIYVLYVLDMAEIPAYQERQQIRDEAAYAERLTRRIQRRLALAVGGKRVALRPLRHTLAFPAGAAGLRTLRLEIVYAGAAKPRPGKAVPLTYRDRNFAGRIGWREVVIRARDGAEVVSSSVPETSISRQLRAYPQDLLGSPLEVETARASFVPGAEPGPPAVLSAESARSRRAPATGDRGFAELIAEDDLSTGFVLLSLLVAAFWGAAHAFSPGHGKAIVAGYLIGTRGTPRHALQLGLIVTLTHTIGVFALGLVTLALSELVVPEQLYPWLNLVSALLVVGVGLAILRWRYRAWRHHRARGGAHAHHEGHDHHHHDASHAHGHGDHSSGRRGLLGIGISAGILPCPTALVVLLAAISLHRIGYGLLLIVAFSVGLAAAVTSIGLVAVTAKRAFGRMRLDGRVIQALPALSALIVLGVGLAMTLRALPALT